MSIEALCQAVKDHLQSSLGLKDLQCDLTADGQPVPMAGQEFLGISDGGWDGQSMDQDLDELCRVQITLTRRIGEFPIDQLGSQLIHKHGKDLTKRARKVITLLHKNYTVMNSANTIIDQESGGSWNGFVTPLWFLGAGVVQFKGPEWFYASTEGEHWTCGVARVLTFGKAQRVQRTSFMS